MVPRNAPDGPHRGGRPLILHGQMTEIVTHVARSIALVRARGYRPTGVRLHHLDAELVIAEHDPASALQPLTRLLDLPVTVDDEVPIGAPFVETDA